MQYKIGKIQIDFFKLIKSILKFHTELSIVLPYNFAFSAFDVVILKFARCANCCGWFANSLFINFCNKIRVDFIKECFHYGSAFFCSSLSVSIRFQKCFNFKELLCRSIQATDNSIEPYPKAGLSMEAAFCLKRVVNL